MAWLRRYRTGALEVDGRDELTEVAGLVDEFAEQVATTVRDVRDASAALAAAEQLAANGGSIAAAARQTSSQAEQVAEASRTVDASAGGFSAAAAELGQSAGSASDPALRRA